MIYNAYKVFCRLDATFCCFYFIFFSLVGCLLFLRSYIYCFRHLSLSLSTSYATTATTENGREPEKGDRLVEIVQTRKKLPFSQAQCECCGARARVWVNLGTFYRVEALRAADNIKHMQRSLSYSKRKGQLRCAYAIMCVMCVCVGGWRWQPAPNLPVAFENSNFCSMRLSLHVHHFRVMYSY